MRRKNDAVKSPFLLKGRVMTTVLSRRSVVPYLHFWHLFYIFPCLCHMCFYEYTSGLTLLRDDARRKQQKQGSQWWHFRLWFPHPGGHQHWCLSPHLTTSAWSCSGLPGTPGVTPKGAPTGAHYTDIIIIFSNFRWSLLKCVSTLHSNDNYRHFLRL